MKIPLILGSTENTITINSLRRSFGEVEKKLSSIDHLIVTKNGKPFAILTATAEVKKTLMKKSAGALKNTQLDNDQIWDEVLKKKSRKEPIKL